METRIRPIKRIGKPCDLCGKPPIKYMAFLKSNSEGNQKKVYICNTCALTKINDFAEVSYPIPD